MVGGLSHTCDAKNIVANAQLNVDITRQVHDRLAGTEKKNMFTRFSFSYPCQCRATEYLAMITLLYSRREIRPGCSNSLSGMVLACDVCYRELQLIDKRPKPARLQTTENEPRVEEVVEWKKVIISS